MLRAPIAALLIGCSDLDKPVGPFPDKPAPPVPPAVLTIAVHTAGRDPDPNGYRLAIDEGAPSTVPANGTLQLSDAVPGTHHVVVEDVARWCQVVDGPEHVVEVGSTGDYRLEIQVDCRTTFRDWLLYDGAGEIRLFDLTGDPAQRARLGYSTISCGGYCTSAAVSSDGGQVAWVAYNGLMIMNADGSGRHLLVAGTGLTTSAPTWSPDGDRIAYVVDDGAAAWDLYVVALDGSTPQNMTSGAFDPAWSPDGNSIIFSRRVEPGASELWLVDPDGGNLRPLGASGSRQEHPSWSPDGESIVYSSNFNAEPTLRMRVISVDGTNDRAVGPDHGFSPDWSRDGRYIAFTAFDETGCRTWLATMANDGTNVVALGPFGEDCELVEPPMPQTNHAEWGY